MVVGKLLFETIKFAAPRIKSGYDLLYAVGAGTAVGIGNNPNVRQAYEFYRGRNYQDYDKWRRWDDKVLTKRFKGDYLVETDNTQQKTHLPDGPGQYRSSGGAKYGIRSGYRRRSKYTYHNRRRCNCKGVLRRAMAKSRFKQRRR